MATLEEHIANYARYQEEIAPHQAEIKRLRKLQRESVKFFQNHMVENGLTELDVNGATFTRENKERVVLTMERLEAAFENPADLEAYRVANTETKESFKIKKAKRRRTADE